MPWGIRGKAQLSQALLLDPVSLPWAHAPHWNTASSEIEGRLRRCTLDSSFPTLGFSFHRNNVIPSELPRKWGSCLPFQAVALNTPAFTMPWRIATGCWRLIVLSEFGFVHFFFSVRKNRDHSSQNPAHLSRPQSHSATLKLEAIIETTLPPPCSALPRTTQAFSGTMAYTENTPSQLFSLLKVTINKCHFLSIFFMHGVLSQLAFSLIKKVWLFHF